MLVAAPILVLLAATRTPAPFACPTGAELRGAAPPDGFEQWCEGKDPYGRGRREGPARSWYDDGAPWKEESYREGAPDGPFLERHRNGKPAREGTYASGQKVGTWRIYFESGVLEEESEWRDGVPHGRFLAFWPSGARRAEGRYCGGAQCGRWRSFAVDGSPAGDVDYVERSLTP